MSRTLKFRAWNTKNKTMFSAEEMATDQLTLLTTGQFINVHSASPKLSVIYPIDVMVPMQFTGFLDKNGKEIYEGDILVYKKIITEARFPDKNTGKYISRKRKTPKEELHYYEVFFSPKGQWCMRRTDKNDVSSSLAGQNDRHEVVGNIYDNPELVNQ